MTTKEFLRRRIFIHKDARVRTVIFRFRGNNSHEWAEVFVDERYETIEQQEQRFRSAMTPLCDILTPEPVIGQPLPTVSVEHWLAM